MQWIPAVNEYRIRLIYELYCSATLDLLHECSRSLTLNQYHNSYFWDSFLKFALKIEIFSIYVGITFQIPLY